jgi:hypothetical protein
MKLDATLGEEAAFRGHFTSSSVALRNYLPEDTGMKKAWLGLLK